jgi:NitT/TauT family transport system permease protein
MSTKNLFSTPKDSLRDKFTLPAVLLFLYVLLFEFVLPVNKVLPKPSLLWESLIAVWSDYNLLQEISTSTLIIYAGLLLSYVIIFLLRVTLLKMLVNVGRGLEKLSFLKYFPAFFFAVLFAYWFPNSFAAELLFVFVASIFYLCLSITQNLDLINENHVLTARNLGCNDNKIYADVVWKSLLPSIFSGLNKIHFLIWILILLYEFIGDYFGIGHVYNTALQYNDFAGLFSIAIYVALLIKLGSILIDYSKSKVIYWV